MAASPSETPRRSFLNGIVAVTRRLKWIWLVPVFAAVSLGAWALASPVGASPDEDYHLASIWCANEGRTDLCEPSPDGDLYRVLPAPVAYTSCFVADPEQSGACQIDLTDTEPRISKIHGNWRGAYPPLFYSAMNTVTTSDVQASVLTMRYVNIAIFLALTTTLAWLLPGQLRTPLIASWAMTIVPLTGFLIASSNPASWAITGVGSAWIATLGWFRTAGWRMWALGGIASVAAVMAAGARTDAAVFVCVGLGIAAFLAFERSRVFGLKLLLPAALVAVAAIFYFTSGYASVASTGLTSGIADGESRDQFAVLAYNIVSIPQLWTGVFGSWGLGWRMEVWPGFAMVEFATLAVFIGLASIALRVMNLRKSVMVIALVATLYALPVYILTQGLSVVSENVQPRYLVPLVVVLAGLLMLPVGSRIVRPTAWHVIPAMILLSGANSIALYTTLRRYVTGFDVEAPSLDAGAEWWWGGLSVSPNAVWAIGSLTFAAAIALLGIAWLRDGHSPARGSDEERALA